MLPTFALRRRTALILKSQPSTFRPLNYSASISIPSRFVRQRPLSVQSPRQYYGFIDDSKMAPQLEQYFKQYVHTENLERFAILTDDHCRVDALSESFIERMTSVLVKSANAQV
jgi:hypothetical protein